MDERAIGAAALGDAGGWRLPTEMAGPRPAGVPARARAERDAALTPKREGPHAVRQDP